MEFIGFILIGLLVGLLGLTGLLRLVRGCCGCLLLMFGVVLALSGLALFLFATDVTVRERWLGGLGGFAFGLFLAWLGRRWIRR